VPQLIVANKSSEFPSLRISVFRGLPDATGAASGRFAPRATLELDRMPEAMAVADVDSDGLPDVVTTQIDFNNGASAVSWLLGTADGGFAPGGSVSFTGYAGRLAIGDIDGDGHRDVAVIPSRVAYGAENLDLVILWGTASGGFSTDDMLRLPIAGTATDVVIADVDGDGRRDVVTAQAGEAAGRIEVRRGLPTLDPADRTGRVSAVADTIAVDGSPQRIIAHDMNRDGVADIVAACDAAPGSGSLPSGSVVVLHSVTGAGWFAAATSGIGSAPGGVTAADVDGDDIIDVVVTSATDNSAAVLVGTAAGGLRGPMPYGVGKSPQGVTTGDLDGDGRPEIVTADMASGTATILWQRADGSFTDTTRDVGTLKVVAADVNGDGRMDAITLAPGAQDVSVLIGRGDGTFSQRGRYRIGGDLVSVAVGDLNGDGRLDIVAANRADPSAGVAPITILFGRGDGSFDQRVSLTPDGIPSSLAVDDVDGDGTSDIVFTTFGAPAAPGQVTVLFNARGSLAFTTRLTRDVGQLPVSVTVADIDADGRKDLLVANFGGSDATAPGGLTLLLGAGGATLAPEITVDVRPADPDLAAASVGVFGATVGQMLGDSRPDVALTMSQETSGNSLVILGDFRDGRFGSRQDIPLSSVGTAPVAGDVDGDGNADVAVAITPIFSLAGTVGVFTSRTGFSTPLMVATDRTPQGVAIADLDGDGRQDLLGVDDSPRLFAWLGQPSGEVALVGAGTFVDRLSNRVVPLPPAPGFPGGTVTLDITGSVRIRLDGEAGAGPPAGVTAFDVAAVRAATGEPAITTIDADRRGVSLYAVRPDGGLGPRRRLALPDVGGRPAVLSRIRSVDVDGDGNGDIVVSDPGTGSIRVLLAGGRGDFVGSTWQPYEAGAGVSQFVLADVNRDGRADLVAADQVSGDVSVRLGAGATIPGAAASAFGPERRYRATSRDAAFAIDPLTGRGTPVTDATIDDVAVADVDDDGRPDIVVTSSAEGSYAVLAGLPGGGFAAPALHYPRSVAAPGPTLFTRPVAPRDIATGDFDGDGEADLAVLDRANEEVLVYLSGRRPSGRDPFAMPTSTIPLAGNAPTSLAATDAGGPAGRADGVLDLVVGNDYGDVLVLRGEADARGRGTGRFARSVRADAGVALVATDVDGDGRTDFIYGSRSLDRVAVNSGANATIFAADQTAGVIGPSAVKTVTERVGGTVLTDLLVANGAGNELLLFPRSAGGGDAFLPPRRFFVGTNPTAIATGDLNDDGITDVAVANGGSNDLSIMLGATGGDGRWTLVAGPRLALGGARPTALDVGDFATLAGRAGADGIPDIAVTTAGAGGITLIPGVGRGYFADNALLQLALPEAAAPTAVFALPRGGGRAADIVVVNAGTNSISTFDGGRGFARADIGSGGLGPRAAAVYSAGGSTVLAVANAGTGNVSMFLASASSLTAGGIGFANIASSPFANASALAFDSTGQLFGTAGGNESPLALYSFSQAALTPTVANATLRALINFLPSQASGIGLVATLVTSAGIPVADQTSGSGRAAGGRATAARTDDAEILGGEGEPPEPVAEDAAREKSDVAVTDTEAAPILRFFLDVEATLEDTNARLLEDLLSHATGQRVWVSLATPAENEAPADATAAAAAAPVSNRSATRPPPVEHAANASHAGERSGTIAAPGMFTLPHDPRHGATARAGHLPEPAVRWRAWAGDQPADRREPALPADRPAAARGRARAFRASEATLGPARPTQHAGAERAVPPVHEYAEAVPRGVTKSVLDTVFTLVGLQ